MATKGSAGSKVRETTLANRSVLASIAKSIVVLRMIFIFPIIQNWAEYGAEAFEVIILLLLAAESVIALLSWDRVHRFIAAHPLLVSVDILLSVVVLGTSGSESPFFLYLGATAVFIGLVYEGRNRLILGALTLCAYLLIPLAVSVQHRDSPFSLSASAFPLLGSLVILILLMYLGSWLHGIQQKIDIAIELAARNARDAALGEERSRVARELHDSTVKSLVGIKLLSESIAKDPDKAQRTANVISSAADTAIDQSRGILSTLRSKAAPPLRESIQDMVDELEVIHQIPIHVSIRCDEVPAQYRYHIKKITEEAITNAAMHSGTTQIDVTIGFENDRAAAPHFFVEVRDYGRGFRPAKAREGHIGMASMRERAAEIGGTVSITSGSGAGTAVRLRIPLPAGKDAADEIPAQTPHR